MFSRALASADLQSLELVNCQLVGRHMLSSPNPPAGVNRLQTLYREHVHSHVLLQRRVCIRGGTGTIGNTGVELHMQGTLAPLCTIVSAVLSTPQGDDFVAGLVDGSLLSSEKFSTLRLAGCGLGDMGTVRLAKAVEAVGKAGQPTQGSYV